MKDLDFHQWKQFKMVVQVLISNVESLKEIYGDSVIYIDDPLNIEEWSQNIEIVLFQKKFVIIFSQRKKKLNYFLGINVQIKQKIYIKSYFKKYKQLNFLTNWYCNDFS